MLAKMTTKNQITIPKKIVDQLPETKHFDVQLKDGSVILTPVAIFDTSLSRIRTKVKALGLTQDTVADAVKWAREK